MLPLTVVAKSIQGNDVVVNFVGSKKESVMHSDVVLVWGTDRDKEILKTILN